MVTTPESTSITLGQWNSVSESGAASCGAEAARLEIKVAVRVIDSSREPVAPDERIDIYVRRVSVTDSVGFIQWGSFRRPDIIAAVDIRKVAFWVDLDPGWIAGREYQCALTCSRKPGFDVNLLPF